MNTKKRPGRVFTHEERLAGGRKRWLRNPSPRISKRYRELLERSAQIGGLGVREARELNSLQARLPKAVRRRILQLGVQQGIEGILRRWGSQRDRYLDLFDRVKQGIVTEAEERELDQIEAEIERRPLAMPWRRYRVALNVAHRSPRSAALTMAGLDPTAPLEAL